MIENSSENRDYYLFIEKFVIDFLFNSEALFEEEIFQDNIKEKITFIKEKYYTNGDKEKKKKKTDDGSECFFEINKYSDDIIRKDLKLVFDLESSYNEKSEFKSFNYFKFFDNFLFFKEKEISSYLEEYINEIIKKGNYVSLFFLNILKNNIKNKSTSWSSFIQNFFKDIIIEVKKEEIQGNEEQYKSLFYDEKGNLKGRDEIFSSILQDENERERYKNLFENNKDLNELYIIMYFSYKCFLYKKGLSFEKFQILHKKFTEDEMKNTKEIKTKIEEFHKSCFYDFYIKCYFFDNNGKINFLPYVRNEISK